MRRSQSDDYKKLIPLKRIAEASSYSFGYVSILVQRKKLKAKKIGNKYYSTKEWFDQYLGLHARDEKRLSSEAVQELSSNEVSNKQLISESVASAKLKSQIDNLVDRAVKEKLANRIKQEKIDSVVKKVEEENKLIQKSVEEKVYTINETSPNKLEEILNNKIITPEAKFIADFVEPEIRLKVKWQENLHQEAKDFLTQQSSIVKKIKTEKEFFSRKKNLSFSPRLFKTALATIIIVLALISLTVFTPSIKVGANKIIKNSLLNNNKIIPGEELVQESKNSLDSLFLTLADRISASSLKLEDNFKRRNQILALKLGAVKDQALFITGFWQGQYQKNVNPLFQLAKNEFSGLNLGLTILPDEIVNFGQSSLAILKSFINYQGESVGEIAYLIQEEVNSKPEQIESNNRQGKVAGVSETASFASSPMPRLLALANTTSRRGQEVINQTKYNAGVVLEDLAYRQKELSLDFGRKLAKLTLATAKGVGLVSKSGQAKLAQAGNAINQTNNSAQQIGGSIQEYNINGKNYLANEAGRSLWSLSDLYSKFIDIIFPKSLKNKYAKYYLIEIGSGQAGTGQAVEQSPTTTEKIVNQTTIVQNSSPVRQVVAPTPKNLSIIGDTTVGGALNVSGATKLKDKLTVSGASEFLGDALFSSALTVKDLIVTGSIKLNGVTITDGSLITGPQIVNNNTYITGTFSAGHTEVPSLGSTGPVGSQSLSAGEGGLTVGGDTSLNGEHVLIAGMVDLNNLLDIDQNGLALSVGDGTNDTFTVNTSDDIVTITGSLNHSGISQFNGDMDLNGALDLDVASTSALTVGDGTNDNIRIDTINDILNFGNSSTTDQMILNLRELTLNSASSTTALTVRQDGDGDIINIFDGANEVFTILDGGNVGIGTSSPLAKLTVVGTGTDTAQLINFSNGGNVQLFSLLENGSATFSGVPTGSGVGQGSLYINPLSGGSGAPVFSSWSAEATWNIAGLGTLPVPVLADLDDDGDQDLLIGLSDGASYAYENTGTVSSPTWAARSGWDVPDIGDGFAFPATADLDNDGDYDLLIGSPDGTMYAYENTGTASAPTWTQNLTWVTPDLGNYHFPALADLDNDGDYDLMIGVLGTPLYAYENTGTVSVPTWTAKSDWNIAAPDSAAFFPAFTDLDNDGDQDLFIGEWMGGTYGLYAYENTGDSSSPTWTAHSSWNIADIGSVETPTFADLDNDGDQDLMLGEMNGTVHGYEQISSVLGNTLFGVAVNSSEKFKITSVGDVNMTGDLDVGGGANVTENLIVSGNIGAGVVLPLNRLDVNGGAVIGAAYAGTSTAPTNGLLVEGHVGIGTDSPTALLQLGAGTATAGTAPLKFTSGTLLTTPEAGAMEFLNDDYYLTISSGLESQYPPAQSATYVKATTENEPGYMAYFATDPTKSLIGDDNYDNWNTDDGITTNQRFHVDLGSTKTVTRIYYENAHDSGNYTNSGARNFTFWGSNESSAFDDLTYGDDANWTQLTTSATEFEQHIAANTPDPKYITVVNVTPYRYYAFKFADNWGASFMAVRRIELQSGSSGSGSPRKGIVLNDGVNLVSGRVPFATTNGRLTDSSNLVFTGTNLGIGTSNPLGIFDARYGQGGLDAYTKFLLQADENDNSFIDSSESANTITAYGDVTQSSTQSKFGGKSAYFDGSGDYLSFPNSTDFAFGTGDYTIDFWINAPYQENSFILGGRSAIGQVALTTGAYCGSTPGGLRFTLGDDGCNQIYSTTVIADNTWHHCVIVRESGNIIMYIDGVEEATWTDANDYTNTTGTWFMGMNDWGGGSYSEYLTGYLDEFRISNGIARWTSDFAPSTEQYDAGQSGILLADTGNVGIGTSSPLTKLSIQGAAGSDILNIASSTGASLMYINAAGNVGIGTTTPWGLLSVNANGLASSAPQFVVGSSTATNLIVTNNGYVGIGTTTALSKLSIYGGWDSHITLQRSGNPTGHISVGTNTMSLFSGDWAGNGLFIQNTGNVGIGTTSPYAKLSVAGDVVADYFHATSTTATSTFAGGLQAGGSTGLYVLQNGKVGLGLSSPTYKLEVQG
ncbi:MAG: LamG-like jellyroll fold domain-containing protein, partial [Patescibacteria group bacterium]